MELIDLDLEILGVLDDGPVKADADGDAAKAIITEGTNLHDVTKTTLSGRLKLLDAAGFVELVRISRPGPTCWEKISITQEGRDARAAALASSAGVSSPAAAPTGDEDDGENVVARGFAEVLERLGALQKECEDLEGDAARARHERDGYLADCDDLRSKLSTSNTELEAMTADRDRLAEVLASLQGTIEAAKAAAPATVASA